MSGVDAEPVMPSEPEKAEELSEVEQIKKYAAENTNGDYLTALTEMRNKGILERKPPAIAADSK